MMGGIVTRNMQSKAIAKNKRNCCILLELFHHYLTHSWSRKSRPHKDSYMYNYICIFCNCRNAITQHTTTHTYTHTHTHTHTLTKAQDRCNKRVGTMIRKFACMKMLRSILVDIMWLYWLIVRASSQNHHKQRNLTQLEQKRYTYCYHTIK